MNIQKSLHKIFPTSIIILALLQFHSNIAGATSLADHKNDHFSTDCEAIFSYETYDGPMPVQGGFTFENLSTGPFTDLSWDFGDGSYSSATENKVTHFYSQSGSYDVSLTVWNSNTQECFSTVSTVVDVSISDDPCEQLDCVWPGDTDKDGRANLADILNIGLYYGSTGPERDSVCGGWFGHTATDWEEYTIDGMDLKHADCNGDGEISLMDIPLTSNVNGPYTRLENGYSIAESDAPHVKLQFNVDTVRITNSFEPKTISAGLMLGSSSIPLEDVYGVVLYLSFPGQYIDSSTQVEVDYDQNSFFGSNGEVIHRSVDLFQQGQLDFAITRIDGENKTGYGRIATVSFIIIADIIDGREEDEGQPFTVFVNIVKVVDKFGNELEVSLPAEPATVFFVNNITTSVNDPALAAKVKTFPNPVTDVLQIDLGDLNSQTIEVFDMLGKRHIYRESVISGTTELSLNSLGKGVYVLKIQTDQGLVTRKIVKE